MRLNASTPGTNGGEFYDETAIEERYLRRMIPRVKNIMRKMGGRLREEALLIEDEEGNKTILHFETLPRLEPA